VVSLSELGFRSNTATIESFAPLTIGDQYLHDLSLA